MLPTSAMMKKTNTMIPPMRMTWDIVSLALQLLCESLFQVVHKNRCM